MTEVARERPYLSSMSIYRLVEEAKTNRVMENLPCHDVLAVVIPQVNRGSTTNGDSLGLTIIGLHHIRDCEVRVSYLI